MKFKSGMDVQPNNMPFAVTHKQHIINEYTAYLFGAIEDSNDFLSVIEVLNAAQQDDIVRINLSSVGGSLLATDTLLFEIKRAQERGVEVGVIGSGLIASAGSLILLAGTYFELSEDAMVMLHCGSLGESGTLAEFRAASTFGIKYMENTFRKHYRLFLSDEEIEQLINGRDFWLTSEEFVDRFVKRNELLAAEMEQGCECGQCDVDEQQEEAEQQASSLAPQEDKRSVPPPYAKRSRKKPEAQQGE